MDVGFFYMPNGDFVIGEIDTGHVTTAEECYEVHRPVVAKPISTIIPVPNRIQGAAEMRPYTVVNFLELRIRVLSLTGFYGIAMLEEGDPVREDYYSFLDQMAKLREQEAAKIARVH
jgi:hypothetical protein